MPSKLPQSVTRRRQPYKRKYRTFISKRLAFKRNNADDTKMFYFKTNGISQSDIVGTMNQVWNSRALTQTPGAFPQFVALKALYDQFKVLSIRIRWFPANVGIEPHDALLGADQTLLRGNTITWLDQRADDLFAPLAISEVINDSSARMHASRKGFSRTIYRGSGFNAWGNLQNQQTDDSWNGSISILTVDATPAVPPATFGPTLYYWTAAYKVLFRARRT